MELQNRRLLVEDSRGRHGMPLSGSDFPEEVYQDLRRLLISRRQIDLGAYKEPCIKRRIAKRARSLGIGDIRSYLSLLRHEAGEIDTLLATLTIHVSQFFRNPSVFTAIEGQILPELVRRAQQDGRREILVWSAGCAGGEEPYSLALQFEILAPGMRTSILATDVSGEVLAQAAEGVFDPLRVAEVPPALLERYFLHEENKFRLDPRIRQRVRFEPHNLLAAAVYPSADLILCRNVLIYFSRAEQEKILQRFAASLEKGGVLVLGKSETLLGAARPLFRAEIPGERIYRRVAAPVTGTGGLQDDSVFSGEQE